jgi:hypothetical protein
VLIPVDIVFCVWVEGTGEGGEGTLAFVITLFFMMIVSSLVVTLIDMVAEPRLNQRIAIAVKWVPLTLVPALVLFGNLKDVGM